MHPAMMTDTIQAINQAIRCMMSSFPSFKKRSLVPGKDQTPRMRRPGAFFLFIPQTNKPSHFQRDAKTIPNQDLGQTHARPSRTKS